MLIIIIILRDKNTASKTPNTITAMTAIITTTITTGLQQDDVEFEGLDFFDMYTLFGCVWVDGMEYPKLFV